MLKLRNGFQALSEKCGLETELNETAEPWVKTPKRSKHGLLLGPAQQPVKRLKVCLPGRLNGTIGHGLLVFSTGPKARGRLFSKRFVDVTLF